ncbi:hypothetical protein B4144_1122 [Bacillus atrophaeus]|nr:hypothetical protein B4144_1122 [Bacillus atrophaeus]
MAMVMIMLLAFCAASFTHVGAEGAILLHKRLSVCIAFTANAHMSASFSVQPDTAA